MTKAYRSRELVQVFFASVAETFSFLSADDGWKARTELRAAWSQSEPTAIGVEELPDDSFFWASAEFTRDLRTVQVTYGDREFDIETVIGSGIYHGELMSF